MKKLLLLGCVFAGATFTASAASVCPSTSDTNTDCGFIVTINPGGTISTAAVPGANPYDGNDDALVGIVNNSGAVFNGSFSLSGSSVDGGIFEFEGDGICTYVNASYCATAATGYEGPGVTFSNISSDYSTGTINVANLAAGATTYFSLEGAPGNIQGIGTPEPASLSLFGLGAAGAFMFLRKRKAA